MITYPKNWRTVGTVVTIQEIENRLEDTLLKIDCQNLAFSGGLDSSLLLYYMCLMYDKIKVFTIGKSSQHPDVVFAVKVADCYRREFKNADIEHHIYYPQDWEVKDHIDEYPGDRAVELFYQFVSKHTNGIIAGDGIDEFMCGYYTHMENPNEETYYNYIRKIQKEQLVPLNLNSGSVNVYLPYLDEKMLTLLSQIPLQSKVDKTHRKKFMVEIALGKVPKEAIERRKYGFCDTFIIKK